MLEAFSVSHGKATAYLPLVELLKSYFRIELADDERQRREKITGKVLTLDRALEDTLAYLFSLLGIADEAAALAQMDPQIRRQRTLEAVKRVLVRETLDRPCVLIFEDLHWIDAETQAFLDLLSESRGDGQAPAAGRLPARVPARLGQQERLHAAAAGSTRARRRPGSCWRPCWARGLRRSERPSSKSSSRRARATPSSWRRWCRPWPRRGYLPASEAATAWRARPASCTFPATVQGVLAARIDRLPAQQKELLQTLAVIGREFPFGLIKRVAEGREESLHGRLSQLEAGEFIYEQPAFPEPEYLFKHALTQEVAYHSLLGERRKALHERTGQAIGRAVPRRARRALQRAGASLRPDRQHPEGGRVPAPGRRAGRPALGLRGRDRPARQGGGPREHAA